MNQRHTARGERGFSLAELALYLGVVAVLATASVISMSANPMALASASAGLRSMVDAARALAATTGDGATIVVSGDPSRNFSLALYPHRPVPTGTTPPSATADAYASREVRLTIDGNGPPVALFVSSSGTIAVGSWLPGLGSVTPQACTSTLPVVFAAEARTQTWTLDCASGRLLPPP